MGDLTVWVAIALAAIAVLAGFIHSGIGFGFGIVAIGLMPLVIDTRSAHVVISTSSLPVLMGAAWAYRHGFDWRSLRGALIGGAIGMPIGLFAFETLPLDWLTRITGLAILVMIAMSFRNRNLIAQDELPWHASFAAGWLSGFLAGAVSIAGPPIAAFALRQQWTQERFKAFVNQFLLIISVFKITGLGVRGYLDSASLYQAGWIALFAVIGIAAGAKASSYLSNDRFRKVVAAILVVIAIYFLVQGS